MLWTHCCCRTVAVLQRCCNVSQSPSQRHRNARCTHQDQSYIHTTIATRGTPCLRTSSSDSGNLCETNYHPPHRYPPFFGTADTTVPPSFIATFLFSELPYNSFHGVISESPDIVRAGKRIMLGCGQILCLSTATGVNPVSKKYSAYNVWTSETTRSFSPPDFSCLRLGRNRDRGSTVPPVRFPGVKIGMGVEFVSLVWKAGMWAFVNTFRR